MLVYRAFAVGIFCTFAQAVAAANTTKPLNGWYLCSEVTISDSAGRPTTQAAECAVYSTPLCYPGICKAPATADPAIGIFVKRLPASAGNVATAHNA
ncbi:hypothetical protein ON010_g660 [Phytophthora cinnamomi]|nr:hypothetical protein ON010_g660 [Phytophthora cinnamomi]